MKEREREGGLAGGAAGGSEGGSDGVVRTYFLQDLRPIPRVLWGPRKVHIKSLSKKAKSGHVSLQLSDLDI